MMLASDVIMKAYLSALKRPSQQFKSCRTTTNNTLELFTVITAVMIKTKRVQEAGVKTVIVPTAQ